MDIRHFYAMRPGPAPKGRGDLAMLSVVDVGQLQVPSGELGACDPFVSLQPPQTFRIPPGAYPARVTLADVSEEHDGSHMREAYLSVVISQAPSVFVGPAQIDDSYSSAGEVEDEGELGAGKFWGVGVDTGTVAFVDSAAVAPSMPDPDAVDWDEEIFDNPDPRSWYSQVDSDSPYPAGTANIVMPLAKHGENVVLCRSGWGDGFYPVIETRDVDGNLTGIHIDMRVVGDSNDGGRADTPVDRSRDLDVAGFFALKPGQAPQYNSEPATLTVADLGQLRVPSGNLGSCDVFVQLDASVVTPIAPGDYPVQVTMADVSDEQDGSDERQAYLSVILSEEPYTAVEPAPIWAGFPPVGDAFGFPVDAGVAGFVDAAAVTDSMPSEGVTSWHDAVFDNGEPDSWFEQIDSASPYPEGAANIVMPLAKGGENVVFVRSGWGDGFYPILQTRAADGTVTGIHIDFGVVGSATDDLSVRGPGLGTAPAPSEPKPTAAAIPAGALTAVERGYLGAGILSAIGIVASRFTPIPWWVIMPVALVVGLLLIRRLARPLMGIVPLQGGAVVYLLVWLIALGLALLFAALKWDIAWWLSVPLFVAAGWLGYPRPQTSSQG